MLRSRRLRAALIVAGLLAAVVGVYAPGLHGAYYGDDLYLRFAHPERLELAHFFARGSAYFFRPLDHAYLARVQAAVGGETGPIHALALAYHLAVGALTYAFGRALRLGRGVSGVGAAFVLLHEAAPYGVAGVDTLSQLGSTAWGMLALVLLVRAQRGPAAGRAWAGVGALGAFALALLYKETAAAYLPLAGVLALACAAPAAPLDRAVWGASLLRAVRVVLPFAVLFGVYLAVRAHAITATLAFNAEDRYGLHVGLNVPKNLAQFAAAALLTGSTVQAYLDAQAHAWGRLALVGVGTAAFAGAVAWGLWRARAAWKPVVLLGVLALGACFPAALLNQVSELYTYTALPFAGLLVGIAGEALGRRAGRTRRAALSVGALVLVLVHLGAARQKVALMQARGEEARRLLAAVVPTARALPPGGRLVLRNAAEGVRYSVFILPGFEVLHWGEPGIVVLAGRPDVTVVFADPAPVTAGPAPDADVTLVYDGGQIVPLVGKDGAARP